MATARAQEKASSAAVDAAIIRAFNRTWEGESVSAPEEAVRIVEWFRLRDPEALNAWLDERAVSLIGPEIQRGIRSIRSKMYHQRGSDTFQKFREAHEAGDSETAAEAATDIFLMSYRGVDLFKPLGKFTRKDCEKVIADREARAERSLIDIAVMRVLLKRLPNDETTVDQVIGREELESLFDKSDASAKRIVKRV